MSGCCDLDGDGRCELIADRRPGPCSLRLGRTTWASDRSPCRTGAPWPSRTAATPALRFVDLDDDGRLDVLFSNEEAYGSTCSNRLKKGWSRRCLPASPATRTPCRRSPSTARTTGPSSAPGTSLGQNEDTALLKDLVDRRSFNDLLAGVEPGPKSPEQSLQADDSPAGLHGRAGRRRAAGAGPDRLRLGAGRQAAGSSRWATTRSAPTARASPAAGSRSSKTPTATAGTTRRPSSSTAWLPDRRAAVAEGRARHLRPGHPLRRGHRRRRQGRQAQGRCSPASRQGNQQHRVNGLVWGLDNWVYGANGDSGGVIKSGRRPARSVNIRGRDFRFRPDTGEFELDHRPVAVRPLPRRLGQLVRRQQLQPGLALRPRRPATCAATRTWRPPTAVHSAGGRPGPAPVFPISRTLPRFNDPHTANRFTSACRHRRLPRRPVRPGPAPDPLRLRAGPQPRPPAWSLAPDGPTFTGRRAADEQRTRVPGLDRQLVPPDRWPGPARTGRCGSPTCTGTSSSTREWIPKDWQKKLDLRAGHDKGRIYRVTRVGAEPPADPAARQARHGRAGRGPRQPERLAARHGPHDARLAERQGRRPPLEKLARESKNPLARLHALATLDGLNALKPELLQAAR